MSKPILYLSFDVETDGPSPCLNNMLSIGICAMNNEFEIIDTFYSNIIELEGHIKNVGTMEFWNKEANKIPFEMLQTNKEPYQIVCQKLSNWYSKLNETYKLKFMAGPAAFDWQFLNYYYQLAINKFNLDLVDIGYGCLCLSELLRTATVINNSIMKTREINLLKKSFDENSQKSNIMNVVEEYRIKSGNDYTELIKNKIQHHALYDAIEQGILYVKYIKFISTIGEII